jgi:uncharacterized membrane protein YsdA (DUF1294 family)/cold shock CspA family protein
MLLGVGQGALELASFTRLVGRRCGDVGVIVRLKGRITKWNAERGFGFVTPAGGGERVFLHITALSDRRCQLAEDEIVTYELELDERKRPRAVNVRRSRPIRTKPHAPTADSVKLVVASLFILLIIATTLNGILRFAVAATYAVGSVLTFVVYWFDKSAAQGGRWRTKESSLLLLGLAGGWPGAVVAQTVLRHKSRKASFQVPFWGTVVMNSAALGWLLTDNGSKFIDQLLQ